MTTQLRVAEKDLAIALERFDRIEGEISTYRQQHAEAAIRERELREQRAPLDTLASATARRIAAESLLEQARADLEPAREQLEAAEAVAVRERLLDQEIALEHEARQNEADLQGELQACEGVIAEMQGRLLVVQERIEQNRVTHAKIRAGTTPPARPAELLERGGSAPPQLLAKLSAGYIGLLPDHPLREIQTRENPLAWAMFHAMLARRLAAQYAEAERQRTRETMRKLGAGTKPDYR